MPYYRKYKVTTIVKNVLIRHGLAGAPENSMLNRAEMDRICEILKCQIRPQ